jgi:hypothetical protein
MTKTTEATVMDVNIYLFCTQLNLTVVLIFREVNIDDFLDESFLSRGQKWIGASGGGDNRTMLKGGLFKRGDYQNKD